MTKYDELIKCAISAREKAYAPYSQFKVGAALLCKDGKIYSGCNIESSAYSDTVCAERVAFFNAISLGHRDFSAIAIVGGKDKICDFVFPCGTCRQVMQEFCTQDFNVVVYNGEEAKCYTLKDLLPYSFNKESIK